MPTYVYKVILEDGIEGPEFEYKQALDEPALEVHPVTGHKVERVIQMPNLGLKHTPGEERKILDNSYLDKKGFIKYERDRLTGKYHKVAGKEGPELV